MLDLRLAETDNEISDAAFSQKTQQRQRSGKWCEFADRAIEISFTGNAADFFRVFRAEVASNFSIDVLKHRIGAEGAHAGTIDRFSVCLESGFHHGLRSITVIHRHTLAKTVIERVIQIKDYAADDWLRGAAHLLFATGWRDRIFLLFSLGRQRHHLGVISLTHNGYCDIHSNHCYNPNMEAKLLHIPWMVSVLYSSIPLFWFAIHPFADFWRRMSGSPYRLLLPIWAAIISALAWATCPWHSERFYSSPWMWAPAALLMVFGLRTYTGIRSGFGARKLSGEAELRPREHAQELVTTGLHARMRHPIYFAHLLNMAAWALGSGLVTSFVLFAISALVTFPLMVWIEEHELEKRFGQRFLEYKERVPLIPLPFQRISA